jgi:Excalibur calcium-binding domain
VNISRNGVGAAVLAAGVIVLGVAPVATATGAVPSRWKNCTNVHKSYPHGVGKLHARDKTSGTPVTTFKHSTRLYNVAMSYNKGLDRDKDGIACEQA